MPKHTYRPDTVSRSDTNPHKDLRSLRRQRNRQSAQTNKYYHYRSVHPSWLNEPCLKFPSTPICNTWTCYFPKTRSNPAPFCPVDTTPKTSTWTKRDMWQDRENDLWPVDRRHHRGRAKREAYSFKYNELALGRRTRQRDAEWGFALDDARGLAQWLDEDVDTVYWDLEDPWGEEEEPANEWGESPGKWRDLEGEEVCPVEDIADHTPDGGVDDMSEEDIVSVNLVDVEEAEYYFCPGPEEDDVVSTCSADEYLEVVRHR